MTDEGYNLSNQLLANELGIEFVRINPYWWFSDFVGACWLKFVDGYGLWCARLGGILLSSLIVMLGIRMISLVYKPHLGLLLTMLGAALYSHTSRIIYYGNVPALIFIIFGLSFLKLVQDPSKRLYQILTGLSLALLILSKWPMLLALSIPVIVLVACFYLDRMRTYILFKSILTVYGIVFASLAIFCSYLSCHGLLKDFLHFSGPAQEHGLFYQVSLWYRQLRTIVPLLIIFFGLPLLFYAFMKEKSNKLTIRIFLALFVFSIFLSFFRSKWFCPFADVQVVFIITYLLCAVMSAICIYVVRHSLTIQEFALFIMGIALPLTQTFCSSAGLGKAFEGMWILGGIMLCLFLRVAKINSFENCKNQLYAISIIMTLVVSYYGIKFTYFYTGGDSSNLSKLTCELNAQHLKGIYTTPNRKESYDALMQQMAKYTKKGDRILAYFNIPMVYYSSSTLPLGNHAWLAFLTPEKLKLQINEFSSSNPPIVIVKSKTDTLDPEWGLKPLRPFEHYSNDKSRYAEMLLMNEMLDSAASELWHLELVWSNPDFDLFTARVRH